MRFEEKKTALKAHQTKPIRWAGSKLPIASRLERYIDFDKEYYEPFAGSAVLFFRNSPRDAYLNDLNGSLVDFYRDARTHPEKLWKTYSTLPADKETYYWVRSEFNRLRKCVRRSAYFLYLNHLCFNGIYRTNLKNQFNTPFGGGRLKLIDQESFFGFSELIRDVEFHSLDFENFLTLVKPRSGTVYMDPPYYTEGQRVFREYGPKTFSHDDLIRLSDSARKWANRGCRVVVSYRECPEFRDLFGDCIQEEVSVSRNVGGFKSRRNSQKELIAVLA
ncbi:Dam family site-specific DNA-(adenine-N6)-methyltransferase [Epibacterium sp. SM1979]|uniref:Site-specific DNA-methyltransferase (adenine-specific) n=1 Tax=Tritonibacter litoralis TaxID=2662264 RepID=A0A843YIK3_9RHOB|nr:Dam family site-specific DNA-(adenine-N6)-methyltransferase [Tritonibacter litoralis]